tara:strand:+ start:88 stop:279 length:192 start_codon:yes stop_codon:yes gene_type:complete
LSVPQKTPVDSDGYFEWQGGQPDHVSKNNLEAFLDSAQYENALKEKLINGFIINLKLDEIGGT